MYIHCKNMKIKFPNEQDIEIKVNWIRTKPFNLYKRQIKWLKSWSELSILYFVSPTHNLCSLTNTIWNSITVQNVCSKPHKNIKLKKIYNDLKNKPRKEYACSVLPSEIVHTVKKFRHINFVWWIFQLIFFYYPQADSVFLKENISGWWVV